MTLNRKATDYNVRDLSPTDDIQDLLGLDVRLTVTDKGDGDPGVAVVYSTLTGVAFFEGQTSLAFKSTTAALDFDRATLDDPNVTIILSVFQWEDAD